MVLVDDKCDSCGKCVQVSIESDAYSFKAPSIESECSEPACPINARHQPGPIDNVAIYFVECD
jgi:ferredoxin